MKADPSTKQGLNGSGPAEDRLRVLLPVAAFMLMALCWTTSDSAEPLSDDKRYFNIPQQRADLSLTQFAEQAGLTLLFKFNIAKRKTANNLTGHYTVDEAVGVLLAGTGLHPVFSDQGQLMSVSDDMPETEGGGMKTTNKAGLIAIIAGTLTGGMEAQELTATETEVQTSIVTGKVTDARTGANLKGAKVTIQESGRWTSTNNLGEFRFVNVPVGNATLTVSYLGYAGQSAAVSVRGDAVSQSFALRGGSKIEEIVVFGQRSARAQSLNQERTAQNFTTVLADDFLGQFEGTTVSEALRRAPGIAFEQDTATGDGTNVIVRGLAPDFNTVTLNGLRLPEGSGEGRSPDLGNILADSISKITINKSLLPSMDGSGTGALIDIETKTPLDRPRRFASIGVEGSRSGEEDFQDEFLISGTLSGIFGTKDNLGFSASIQYREQDVDNLAFFALFQHGQYLPLDADGNPVPFTSRLDPRDNAFPFEDGVDEVYPGQVSNQLNGAKTENLTATLSLQWQIANHTDLRFDYSRVDQSTDQFLRDASILQFMQYQPLPIAELDGEVRSALVWEDALAPSFPGALLPYVQTYNSQLIDSESDLLSFRGNTKTDRWAFDYALGYTNGSRNVPNSRSLTVGRPFSTDIAPFDLDFLLPEVRNNTVDGRVISAFAPYSGSGYPLPGFTQAGFDFLNNPDNLVISSSFPAGFDIVNRGSNDRYTAKFDTKYEFDHPNIRYLQAGVYGERAKFFSDGSTKLFLSSTGPSISSVGLALDEEALSRIGLDAGLRVIRQEDINAFWNNIEAIAAENPGLTIDFRGDGNGVRANSFTREGNLAAYVEGRVDIGKLEIIGGVRMESVDVTARVPQFPVIIRPDGTRDTELEDRLSTEVDEEGRQTEFLPRIVLAYRANDNFVFRASYFRTVARPRIFDLSRNKRITLDLQPRYGPNEDQPQLSIGQGNPDLDPAFTDSFDVSGEYYFDDAGVIKASLFYKEISNFLESSLTEGFDQLDGVSLPDDPLFQNLPDNIQVSGTRPENAPGTARIWGIEMVVEKRFTFLPGAWGGLGVFANYTYTDSSRDIQRFFRPLGRDIEEYRVEAPFTGDPKHSGTAAITYNNHGIDASLSYTEQARRLTTYSNYGLSLYNEQDSSLDFRTEYRFGLFGDKYDWRIFAEATDLLKGASDSDVEQTTGGVGPTPKVLTTANYFGGRRFTLGLLATF